MAVGAVRMDSGSGWRNRMTDHWPVLYDTKLTTSNTATRKILRYEGRVLAGGCRCARGAASSDGRGS